MLRCNEQRAKIAIALVLTVLVLDISSIICHYFQYDLLQTLIDGGEVSEEAGTANDSRIQIISILYLVAFITSAVTFIMWFRRAYYNLHQKEDYLAHSDGWAAFSWFLPFVNLYKPYQIMKELYMETTNLMERKGISSSTKLSVNMLG